MAALCGKVRTSCATFKLNQIFISTRTVASVQTDVSTEDPLTRFRTSECDPSKHTMKHWGRFYTIPQDLKKKLYSYGGISKELGIQMETFRENCIIVRKPYLEIISFLDSFNLSMPALRFVIYGKRGNGKSTTMTHLVHYGYVSKYLLLHVPWVSNWTKRPKEYCDSPTRPGRLDLPIESTLWLQHFKLQNADIMKELNLKTTKEYTWSMRETTEQGKDLMEVIDHGLSRVRHASDCAAVLLKEIKHYSQFGKFKTMVLIDGVNAFYCKSNIRLPNRELGIPTNCTIIRAFEKMMANDWNNAVVITTVDDIPLDRNRRDLPYTPRALLGKEAFEILDPFIPVHVDYYTQKELNSTIDYYIERRWIQLEEAKTDKARKEFTFLSGCHPHTLMKLCDPL